MTWNLSSKATMGVVALLVLFGEGGRTVTATPFFLTKIMDTTEVFSGFGARVSVNNEGTAAWYGVRDNGVSGIFAGDGLTTRTIATTGGSWIRFDETPTINDSGDVGWVGTRSNGEKEVRVRRENGSERNYVDTTGFLTDLGSRPQMANEPQPNAIVVGRGFFNGGENIWRSDGSLTTTIATTTSTDNRQFSSPVVSSNGQWTAARATLRNNERNIYSYHGTAPTLIAGTRNGFSNVTVSDITNQGVVAGLGEFADGSQWLFTGSGGDPNKIADTTSYASFADGPAINASGSVVFQATLSNGREGIFTGTGQRIALTGNHLDGRRIENLSLHPQGFNEQGQVAFRVGFDDGVEAIYRADPVVPPVQPRRNGTTVIPTGRKLVVVTHGWSGWLDDRVPVDVVSEMTNAIAARIQDPVRGLPDKDDWTAVFENWTSTSTYEQTSDTSVSWEAFNNGLDVGRQVGARYADGNFDHIHLIGYSAGAAVIANAAEELKARSKNTTVHLTFLDPYIPGGSDDGITNYHVWFGGSADWADNYINRGDFAPTEELLKKAHNVDVTALHADGPQTGTAGHSWPREFYLKTIESNVEGARGYGFDVSLEGGGWANRLQLERGNDPAIVLGESEIGEPSNVVPSATRKIEPRRVATSDTGEVEAIEEGFRLVTGSPVWAMLDVHFVDTVDFLEFDAQFVGTGGEEGLLSVHFDGDIVAQLDERFIRDGKHTYRYLLGTREAGDYLLAFRLDPFTSMNSTVEITRIEVGSFAAIPEPPGIVTLSVGIVVIVLAHLRRSAWRVRSDRAKLRP